MRSIWAVATNTIKQALRMKIAAGFIILLFVLLPTLAVALTGDGTTKGHLQTFVSYSLSLTTLLLSLLTVTVATYSLADDISQRRIYTVLTKPIRRYKLLLGKLLGVVLLDIMLLVPFAIIIYTISIYIPALTGSTEQEMKTLKNEFYTARAGLKPPEPDVRKEVLEQYEQLRRNEDLPAGMSYQAVISQLTMAKKMEKRAAGPGNVLRWDFENVKVTDPNQRLFIRFKYDVSVNPPDLNVYSRWAVGDLRRLPFEARDRGIVYIFDRKDVIRTFHEIEVPANAVAADGYVGIEFLNAPLNDTVVIFPPDEGLELLYKADSYGANFVKAVVLIMFRLVFLACLGLLAASFLSFPVAILLVLAIFVTAISSGFILESFDYLGTGLGTFYKYSVGLVIRMIPKFDKFNPSWYLVQSRLLSWGLVANIAAFMVCLKSGLVFILGLVIFSFREVAKIIV